MKPRPGNPRLNAATPRNLCSLALLGGYDRNGVTLTKDQHRALRKLYEIKPESNPLLEVGSDRNMFRLAEQDGLRMVAWIARHVEPGDDPLKLLIQMASEAGWDVDPEDYEYASEEEA